MKKRINIHEPSFLGREKKYLIDCLNTGWVSTSGKYLNLQKRKIIKITKSKFALPSSASLNNIQLDKICNFIAKK